MALPTSHRRFMSRGAPARSGHIRNGSSVRGGELPWDADGAARGIGEARAALGFAAFDEAWAQGAAMSQDEAVAAARPIIDRAQGMGAARSP